MRDSRRTDRDENTAQNQGQYDADHECLLLIHARHLEAGHNQDENKQVIDGQAVFGDPAGQELHAVCTTVMQPHIQAERERECDIERQCQRGFPDGGLVGPMRNPEHIEHQDDNGNHHRDGPFQGCNVHRALRSTSCGRRSLPSRERHAAPETHLVMTTPRRGNTPLRSPVNHTASGWVSCASSLCTLKRSWRGHVSGCSSRWWYASTGAVCGSTQVASAGSVNTTHHGLVDDNRTCSPSPQRNTGSALNSKQSSHGGRLGSVKRPVGRWP